MSTFGNTRLVVICCHVSFKIYFFNPICCGLVALWRLEFDPLLRKVLLGQTHFKGVLDGTIILSYSDSSYPNSKAAIASKN